MFSADVPLLLRCYLMYVAYLCSACSSKGAPCADTMGSLPSSGLVTCPLSNAVFVESHWGRFGGNVTGLSKHDFLLINVASQNNNSVYTDLYPLAYIFLMTISNNQGRHFSFFHGRTKPKKLKLLDFLNFPHKIYQFTPNNSAPFKSLSANLLVSSVFSKVRLESFLNAAENVLTPAPSTLRPYCF